MNIVKVFLVPSFVGLYDSFRATTLLRDPEIQKGIKQYCAINGGIFLASSLLFTQVVKPSFTSLLRILDLNFEAFVFKTFVVVPIFLLTKFVWMFYDSDVDVYRCNRHRPEQPQRQFLVWLIKLVLDPFISFIVHGLFVLQTVAVTVLLKNFNYVFLANASSLLHTSLLYSLFIFEFPWFSKGWEMNRRLSYVERNWPYFLGFGLPLAFITECFDSWFLSGLVFAVALPVFIVSGSEGDSLGGVCGIFALRIFFLMRFMVVLPLFILTKESVLFKYPFKT